MTVITADSVVLGPNGSESYIEVSNDGDINITTILDSKVILNGEIESPTISTINESISDINEAIEDIGGAISDIADVIYPVDSIYMSVGSTSPATLFGGTWVQLKDRFLLGAGDTYTNGATGGAATHTLSTNEIPGHTHGSESLSGSFNTLGWTGGSASGICAKTYSNYNQASPGGGSSWGGIAISIDASHTHDSVGGGAAHNNMPPYLVVYMWKRTA